MPPLQRRQKNLYLSVEALEALAELAAETGLNESRIVEQMLVAPSPTYEQRLARIERTFDALAETNPALGKIWDGLD